MAVVQVLHTTSLATMLIRDMILSSLFLTVMMVYSPTIMGQMYFCEVVMAPKVLNFKESTNLLFLILVERYGGAVKILMRQLIFQYSKALMQFWDMHRYSSFFPGKTCSKI